MCLTNESSVLSLIKIHGLMFLLFWENRRTTEMLHFGKNTNKRSIFLKNSFPINKPLNNYLISMRALLHAKNQFHNPTHS